MLGQSAIVPPPAFVSPIVSTHQLAPIQASESPCCPQSSSSRAQLFRRGLRRPRGSLCWYWGPIRRTCLRCQSHRSVAPYLNMCSSNDDVENHTSDTVDHLSSTSSGEKRGSAPRKDQYEDVEPELRETMMELDEYADEWIGSNWQRLVWYESMKSKRLKLEKVVKAQEASLEEDMRELRSTLVDLDTLVNVGFIDEAGDISVAGWMVVFLSFLTNCAIVFALCRFLPHTFSSAFPANPL